MKRMKREGIASYMALLFFGLTACLIASAQTPAKKPTIMVVPSDTYCVRNGYCISFDDMGTVKQLPDYTTALQRDSNLRKLLSTMGDLMAKYNYPIQQLEYELKRINNTNTELSMMLGKTTGAEISENPVERLRRTAKADIILDLDYQIYQRGPSRQVEFNITAVDAYTSKVISGNVGVGSPSGSSVSLPTLLEEAVLSFKDNLITSLIRSFADAEKNGREITVSFFRFDSCPIDYESEFEFNGHYVELADIIESWFDDNCVDGRYGSPEKSENMMRFTQVRMPLRGQSLSGKEKSLDAAGFVKSLVSMLKSFPYNLTVKSVPKGLGEVWIIIGEK